MHLTDSKISFVEKCYPLRVGGVLLWVLVVLLPLATLCVSAIGVEAEAEQIAEVRSLLWPSVALAGGVSALAVLLGYLPGRILGHLRTGRGLLLLVILMPLLLPKYLLYYAWSLILAPTNTVGLALAKNPDLARLTGTAISFAVVALWYWLLAALLIAQGWRRMDAGIWNRARLDASGAERFFRITLPLLAWFCCPRGCRVSHKGCSIRCITLATSRLSRRV